MTNYLKVRNEKLAQKLITSFNKRHFEAYFCETKEDALKKAIELIPQDHTVSWGGSMSLQSVGIPEYLTQNGYKVIDRDSAKSLEEKNELTRQGILADSFLLSANAISQDGQLVNIDGLGNRIAALSYGPQNVIVVAGMNKVVKSLDDAIIRARTVAAPTNLQRIASMVERQTPCFLSGACADCISKDSICTHIMITRLSNPEGRIKVILVNEDLGY